MAEGRPLISHLMAIGIGQASLRCEKNISIEMQEQRRTFGLCRPFLVTVSIRDQFGQ